MTVMSIKSFSASPNGLNTSARLLNTLQRSAGFAATRLVPAIGALVLLHGCSGDARPLVEAVEVEELGLESLEIRPPALSIEEEPGFSISTGQQVQFTLIANGGADDIDLDASDRRWSVSDGNVASIDSNGLLQGRVDGEVQVGISIGGVVAEPYTVNVSSAALSAVDDVLGDEDLERCLPEEYVAVGSFVDGSRRLLPDVTWSQTTDLDADVPSQENGRVTVTSRAPGTLDLTASVAGAMPFTRSLNVADNLSEIEIAPATLTVDVDSATDLIARGLYLRGEGDTSVPEVITDGVDWSITTGTDFAAIDNELPDKGTLTGLEAGTATVSVACGNTQTSRDLIVSEATSSSESGLVFEQGSEVDLQVNESRTLRVSTGSEFDEDNVVSNVRFTLPDDRGNVSLTPATGDDTDSLASTVVFGLVPGTTTVNAERDGRTQASITINVIP